MYRIESAKDKIKLVRTIGEILFLLALIVFFLEAVVLTESYEPYDRTDTSVVSGDDKGFIALSYFGVDRTGTETLISQERLGEHLAALENLGYVTITQEDLLAYYQEGEPLPDKALLLMFEDGRRDSAIFAEDVMKKYNYLATILTYAENFELTNSKFLTPDDVRTLLDSSWWELGSNGYRLSYINAYDRYGRFLGELSSEEYNSLNEFIERDYNHYLMDYIRDDEGLPVETRRQMEDRISSDYELMKSIYSDEFGSVPLVYALMHANSDMYGNNSQVGIVNGRCMKELFKINFNREGSSYNDRVTDLYDLTRMQPQAYWYTNHLLMRIKYDLPSADQDEIAFITGDSNRMTDWIIKSGAAEFQGDKIILTSEPEGVGLIELSSIDELEDARVTTEITGNKLGTQTIYLRANDALTEYVSVSIQNNVLVVRQADGGEEEELFSYDLARLDDTEQVSVEEDSKNALIEEYDVRAEYSDNLSDWYAFKKESDEAKQEDARTVEEGADEYVPELQIGDAGHRSLEIVLEGDEINIRIDGTDVVWGQHVDVARKGSVLLGSSWGGYGYSQRNIADDVYDGVFEKLTITSVDGTSVAYENVLTLWDSILKTFSDTANSIINWFVKNL